MKKGRCSEAQLVAIRHQQQRGQTVAQMVRHGLSEATFYAWKSKYAGASVAELTRLKHLAEEKRKQATVRRPEPGESGYPGATAKKVARPAARRQAAPG